MLQTLSQLSQSVMNRAYDAGTRNLLPSIKDIQMNFLQKSISFIILIFYSNGYLGATDLQS